MNNLTFLDENIFNENISSQFLSFDHGHKVEFIQKSTNATQLPYLISLEKTNLKERNKHETYNYFQFDELPKNIVYELNLKQEFQFIVLILTYTSLKEIYRCTGIVIKPNWVLTSAYCLSHRKIWARNIVVVFPSDCNLKLYITYRLITPFDKNILTNIAQERRVSYYRINPEFDKVKSRNDAALLRLKKPFNGPISYGILPFEKLKRKQKDCIIIGFGLIKSSLKAIDGKIRTLHNVSVSTPKIGCKNKKKKGSILCYQHPNGIDSCQGDFGNPLICNDKIIGIATKNLKTFLPLDDHTCHGKSEYYYSDLYTQKKWINNIISKGVPLFKEEKKWHLVVLTFLMASWPAYTN